MNLLFIAAILPVIVLCSYIYKKDNNREPKKVLKSVFIYGCLSVIPVLIGELLLGEFFPVDNLDGFIEIFISVFIGVALVEEGFKWLVTWKYGYESKEFDEIYDIIVYAVFASLGFACIENILYVLVNGFGNAVVRAFTAIPGHTCFGVIMGYYLSKAKINSINNKASLCKKNMLLSIIMPTVTHTLYDAIIFYSIANENYLYVLFFYIYLIIMVIVCLGIVNKTSKVQYNLKKNINLGMISKNYNGKLEFHSNDSKRINYCPICGKNVANSNYCSNCGFKLH